MAFTIGILGSFHCVGMCGPIALALPVIHRNESSKALGILLYNLGRVVTYGLLGALFGFIGEGFFVSGLQQTFSICLGLIILLVMFLPASITGLFKKAENTYARITNFRHYLGLMFRKKTYAALLGAGFFNGFLPCGLVYLAIAGAAGTGNLAQGALFMVFFGLGTIPVMFSFLVIGQNISIAARSKIRKAIPVFAVVFALLLITRGLNLGIPYL
ncbi:MAG: sulfite exporter TauE/SafE family protein, partial [Bacteroidetes bacterium]|nr:sulfite exporter TauE/SafE family protein [Bacteroidota bacterium]